MSVPKYKRETSGTEFLNNYSKIYKETVLILMRDFGIKKTTRVVNVLFQSYQIEEYDRETLQRIIDKYNIQTLDIDREGAWLVDKWKTQIMTALDHIGIEIDLANNIYITSPDEYNERRKHWNNAIGWCHILIKKFQQIISCLNVKLGAYDVVVGELYFEIRLLKGVRKSDRRNKNAPVEPQPDTKG